MMLKKTELRKSLLQKGFVEVKATKHEKYRFYYRGREVGISLVLSRGRREDLRDTLCSIIKREMRLDSSNQLRDFSKCTMERLGYETILKAKKII